MCLAIPGQVVGFADDQPMLARVDVAGVRRNVHVGMLDETLGARRLDPHPRRLRAQQDR